MNYTDGPEELKMDGTFRAADVPEDILDAIKCVTKVFDEALASGKHKPGDWRELGDDGVWEHFFLHEVALLKRRFPDNDDHLANLCCRALMLLQLREEARR